MVWGLEMSLNQPLQTGMAFRLQLWIQIQISWLYMLPEPMPWLQIPPCSKRAANNTMVANFFLSMALYNADFEVCWLGLPNLHGCSWDSACI